MGSAFGAEANMGHGKFKNRFEEWCYRLTIDGCEAEFVDRENKMVYWLVVVDEDARLVATYYGLANELYDVYALIISEDENGEVSVERCHSANTARLRWRNIADGYIESV